MVYSTTITTTASTDESTKTRTVLKVTKGLVYFLEIMFPPGSGGLLKLRILDGAFYLWPTTPGETFYGNNITYRYDDLYLKQTEPFQFVIETWNLDDTYDHTVLIHVGMVSEEVYKARFLPTIANEQFAKLLADLQAEKQVVQKEQVNWGFTILGKQRE